MSSSAGRGPSVSNDLERSRTNTARTHRTQSTTRPQQEQSGESQQCEASQPTHARKTKININQNQITRKRRGPTDPETRDRSRSPRSSDALNLSRHAQARPARTRELQRGSSRLKTLIDKPRGEPRPRAHPKHAKPMVFHRVLNTSTNSKRFRHTPR